jgi:hypothetical protein
MQKADHRIHKSALACSVRADDRDDFSLVYLKGYVSEDLNIFVRDVDMVNF